MSNWTWSSLAADFNALSPAPATLAAAVATLNADTASSTVDVPVQPVAEYLAENGKLPAIAAFAAAPPSGASAAAVTAAEQLMLALEHAATLPVFQTSIPAVYTTLEGWLGDLVIAGLLVAADQTALLALASQTSPKYSPAIIIANLQFLQRKGMISAAIPVM